MGVALSLHLFKSVDRQLSSTRQGLEDRWIYGSEYVFHMWTGHRSLSYSIESNHQVASAALFISSPPSIPLNHSDFTEH